jgi:hypothetical protein
MASQLPIYSIYKVGRMERYYVLQTEQPGYSNVLQSQQDAAQQSEQESRQRLLAHVLHTLPMEERLPCEFIGELQEWPVGDALCTAPTYTELPVYYVPTQYGHPWIILGSAASEEEFMAEVEATEELLTLQPSGPPIKIVATLVRLQDFNTAQRLY